MNVIFPHPVKITELKGNFTIPAMILDLLENSNADFSTRVDQLAKFKIFLHVMQKKEQDARLGNEGYLLKVSEETISIDANSEAGCFYGTQTLRWLLQQAVPDQGKEGSTACTVTCCEIIDYPRFAYRGYMLDEGRRFLGVNDVKSILDWMALLKLNRFHWHLTEDQGWRIEIKKYPKLTSIGSRRASSPRYRNRHDIPDAENADGIPHEGFYTQDQIKEIVAHAAKRYITIIPEIEMPGHATAALASYPEMRCILPDDLPPEGANVLGRHLDGPDIKVSTKWGVSANIMCAGNQKTIDFLHDILKEVAGLFPGPIIHIGGDEVPKTQWMCCDRCQEKITELGISSEEELQKTFTAEIIDYLATLGKKTMLWNEHTDDSLAVRKDTVVCQYWTGTLDKVAGFLESGGRMVMSPGSHVYVDHSHVHLPLKKVHDYEPLGEDTAKTIGKKAFDQAGNGGILGVEAPMWGEVFKNLAQVEHCTFPRVLAISDVAWSPRDAKNYPQFIKRVDLALKVLDALKIGHATLEEADPSEKAIEQLKKHPDFGGYAFF